MKNRWSTRVSSHSCWFLKSQKPTKFLIGMFKILTPPKYQRNSLENDTTIWPRLIGRLVLLPTAMWQSINLFFWKAMGGHQWRGWWSGRIQGDQRTEKRDKYNSSPPNLPQRAEESDRELNVVLILSDSVCACVHAHCACVQAWIRYVRECACQDESSIWKINNHITWED